MTICSRKSPSSFETVGWRVVNLKYGRSFKQPSTAQQEVRLNIGSIIAPTSCTQLSPINETAGENICGETCAAALALVHF